MSRRRKAMKLRASGQDLCVTLISAGSIPGKRDIELQSETRTWAVFGCTPSLSSLYLRERIARVWQEILSKVYKENARCSLLLDLCLYSSFSPLPHPLRRSPFCSSLAPPSPRPSSVARYFRL